MLFRSCNSFNSLNDGGSDGEGGDTAPVDDSLGLKVINIMPVGGRAEVDSIPGAGGWVLVGIGSS